MSSLKHISISQEDAAVFEKVKTDQKLKTDAAVLKYLLNMYMENLDEDIRNQKLVDLFMETFSKNYYAFSKGSGGRPEHPRKIQSFFWMQ